MNPLAFVGRRWTALKGGEVLMGERQVCRPKGKEWETMESDKKKTPVGLSVEKKGVYAKKTTIV